ncbi:MAG: 4-hydroxythreonine-4-phosphate dehydrogenase PdxA [Methyloligellaceae bacterium]
MNFEPNRTSLPLAVTMGDPAGIGPDISLLAWQNRMQDRVPPFFLIADRTVMTHRAAMLGLDVPIASISVPDHASNAFAEALPVIEQRTIGVAITAGAPTSTATPAIVHSIEQAVDFVIAGKAAAIVTNPISKTVLYDGGFRYPGHTEFLGAVSQKTNGAVATPVMMLVAEDLRVVPVTVHIPLKDVPAALNRDAIIQKAQIVIAGLKRYFACDRQRLAVAGLNPHAGESGTMGREEIEIIAPAVCRLQDAGYDVTGPHSADTLFHDAARNNYDAALAMYHDQALIPLKTLAFDKGVNVTLGLPFIRTSPDHGTAFSIAGKGQANPRSLIEALRLARMMFENSRALSGMADHDT